MNNINVDSFTDTTIDLSRYHFIDISNWSNAKPIFSNNKIKIVLFHSSSMGIFYNNLYAQIIALKKAHPDKFDILFITIDPVALLPND